MADTVKSQVESNLKQDYRGIKMYEDYINNRLKLLDSSYVTVEILMDVIRYAGEKKLGKIISNCRVPDLKPFREVGFTVEGTINGYFRGEDAYCVSYFLDKDRSVSRNRLEEDAILYEILRTGRNSTMKSNNEFAVRNAMYEDIPQLIELFTAVFDTYPSPVFDGGYLREVMDSRVLFKVALDGSRIVSVASADIDDANLNAEITDCATYPEYRGRGLLSSLVEALEQDLAQKGFYTLFSLSRAKNHGINMVLFKHGYKHKGRLINNCHICGGFEDMNIWVKRLKEI